MKLDETYDKVVEWLLLNGPRFLFGILVLILGQLVIKWCRRWLQRRMHEREIESSLRPFFHSLLVTLLQVLLLLSVMNIIGIQMTVVTAAVASLGVAAGLALSGTLQNFTSGILILILKPFKVGDIILAQGMEGTVASIQIFYTIVTTADKKTVIIPNNKISNEVIVNMSREGRRRLDVELKFTHAFDLELIRKTMLESLKTIDGVEGGPDPEVTISLVETDNYKLLASVYVDPDQYQAMKAVVNQRLLEGLRAAGVKLPGMA